MIVVFNDKEILNRLDRVESLLKQVLENQKKELEEEEKIEAEEEETKKELEESEFNLEFKNVEDWRKYIWENCAYKVERTEGAEVDFFCKKKNGPCKFDGCPLNYKIEK